MPDYSKRDELANLTLGHTTEYVSSYSPELLQPVPRSLNRQELGIVDAQPFVGEDVWYAYEVSWLNAKGKPVVALAKLCFDASSPNIVESKSLKLYLNSFNQSRYQSSEEVQQLIAVDVGNVSGADCHVELFAPHEHRQFESTQLPGYCIDDLDIEVEEYQLAPSLLQADQYDVVEETLHSHLLKSNCLITNQPDWASVVISYQGPKIKQESLLRYLISFRMHNEFHEQCVERIFTDVWSRCKPQKLAIHALYTRRGGLDINPYRTSEPFTESPRLRVNRQ